MSRSSNRLRVVSAAAPTVGAASQAAARRQSRVELLGLSVTSVVVAVVIWIGFQHQMAAFADTNDRLSRNELVNINDTVASDVLAPVLVSLDSEAERRFASEQVLRQRARGRYDRVGELASISVNVQDAGNPRFETLAARVAANPTRSQVALFTSPDIALIKARLIVRTAQEHRRSVVLGAALFLGAFWLAHLVRAVFNRVGDGLLLPAAQLLTGIGMVTMLGLRDPLRDANLFGAMSIGVALGLAAMSALSFVDFDGWRLWQKTLAPLSLAVGLAAALLIFGSGPGQSGAKVNLLGFQPVEPIKLLGVLALSAFLGRRWELIRELSDRVGSTTRVRRRLQLPRWRHIQPIVIILGSLLVFFVLQRDLGPALVLSLISLSMYAVARARIPMIVGGVLGLAASFATAYWLEIPRTLARRVAIWIDPWGNRLPGGDQLAHGFWALATGGAGGLGAAAGDGQLVPAAHTDLILAVVGEDLGFVGVAVVIMAFSLLIGRMLAVASKARTPYTSFLAFGATLSLAVPLLVIVSGFLGLIPLSGVATPFLSFGKSSMICNLAAIGIVMSAANWKSGERSEFRSSYRYAGIVLAILGVALLGRFGWIQVLKSDAYVLRPALVRQADGATRFQYNPRLLAAARLIPRGTIYDRNGLPVAGNDAATDLLANRLTEVGLRTSPCVQGSGRCYPLGGPGFHLLGDTNTHRNWGAPNSSYVERDVNAVLQGFDDRPTRVEFADLGGARSDAVQHDYSELLPLVRFKHRLDRPEVKRLLDKPRDVHLTIDAPLQALLAEAIQSRVRQAGARRAAAIVLDAETGSIMASVSYPWPSDAAEAADSVLDRSRYGLYPPGSVFKLVTAAAALSNLPSGQVPTFACVRLSDNRVGTRIQGLGRPIRDDPMDHTPHGTVDVHKGLVVSCNAYFAQLANYLGSDAMAEAGAALQVHVARPPVSENLRRTLAYAGYGQGEVLVTPLKMARVAAAIASDGTLRDAPLVTDDHGLPSRANRWIAPADAATLRDAMRDVVRMGTGRVLAGHPVAIAGKTGTAEIGDGPSHSWFIGFAPMRGGGRKIAFAVVVENGGYGGRTAAPLAGDLVTAASKAGLFR